MRIQKRLISIGLLGLPLALLTTVPPAYAAKKKRAAKPAAAAATPGGAAAAPAAESEPELPKKIVQPIYCSVPDETPAGAELKVRCAPRSDVKAHRMTLFYRPGGAATFTSQEMEKSPQGWFVGSVPGAAVAGRMLQYYVEATSSDGKTLASTGREESPEILAIKAPPPPPSATPVANATTGAAGAETGSGSAAGRGFWLGLMVGTGFGYHGSDNLEYRVDIKQASGAGFSSLLHLAPEIGFVLNERYAVSVQGRNQFILSGGEDSRYGGHPAGGAHSILLRGLYTFPSLRPTSRFYAAANLGVGEGVRIVIGKGGDRRTNDTIRVGPVLVGPGGGWIYDFTGRWSAVVEGNLLLGVPDFGIALDVHAGVRARI